jgi:hypothetical protein
MKDDETNTFGACVLVGAGSYIYTADTGFEQAMSIRTRIQETASNCEPNNGSLVPFRHETILCTKATGRLRYDNAV